MISGTAEQTMVILPRECKRDSDSNSYYCPQSGTKFRQGSMDRLVSLTRPTWAYRMTRYPCAGKTLNIPSTGELQYNILIMSKIIQYYLNRVNIKKT